MRKFSRSICLLAALAGCGDDGAQALEPPMCQPDGILRYVHDLDGSERTGELPMNNYFFVNKLSDDEPGALQVGDLEGDHVRVEFEALLPNGDTVPATGSFKIGGLAAGNCEMALPSRITALADDGWTVQLVSLRESPYCDGAAIAGSFAACLIPEPF
jgi:hypothetical protein